MTTSDTKQHGTVVSPERHDLFRSLEQMNNEEKLTLETYN